MRGKRGQVRGERGKGAEKGDIHTIPLSCRGAWWVWFELDQNSLLEWCGGSRNFGGHRWLPGGPGG